MTSLLLPLKIFFYGIITFLVVLYLIYFEQKIISFIQMRQSRKRTLGLRDGLFPFALFIRFFKMRLAFSETPYKFLYILSPIGLGALLFVLGVFIPFHKSGLFWSSDYGILWIIILSHLVVFLMMLIGWASQTQYSLQGIARLFGHFICFGLLFVFISLIVVLWAGTMNLVQIVHEQKSLWFIVPLFPVFIVYVIVLLLLGRSAPFGSSESGINLMGGYKSRYAGGLLTFLVVIEYFQFLLFSGLAVVLFFGGWSPLWSVPRLSGFAWFFLKLIVFLMTISWIKAILPNLRHDQIVRFSFKLFFPFTFILFVFYCFLKIMIRI
jgi:NADH-quinone oxidoreductase subunit H